jgi:chromosomal replication initiation ATPase DnaA
VPDVAAARRVVVDDADLCPDETSLLHLVNSCAEAGRLILLTGQSAPARWPARLPDLSSRLRATQAVGIDPPEEDLLRALLGQHLQARQLALPKSMQEWLLVRLPRSAAAVQQAVARLDHDSLACHQPITRALARASIPDLLSPETADDESADDGSMMDEH